MPDHYIASFEGGEVTRALYGRLDNESYPLSALELKNFIVQPHGGARRRTGTTRFAETVANSRLIGWRAFSKAIIVELQPSMIRLWDAEEGTQIAAQDYDYSENPDTATDLTTAATVTFAAGEGASDIAAGDIAETAISFSDVWKIQYASITKNNVAALILTQEYENPLFIFAYNTGVSVVYGLNYVPTPEISDGVTSTGYHDGKDPRCVGIYNRKIVYGNFENNPNKYLSSTDDTLIVAGPISMSDGDGSRDQYVVFPDFDLNATTPSNEDSIADTTVANEIRWIQGREDLYFGTDEAIIRQHSKDELFNFSTPSKPVRSSEYASSFTQAFIVNESLMFLDSQNTSIRAIQFSNDDQQYFAPSVSRAASHLVEKVVKQVAYASSPNPAAHIVMEDGDIAVLNYDVTAQFANWSRITTDGEYKSVAAVETDTGSLLFYIVKRTESSASVSSDVYLIEKAQPYTEVKADMHYVDAGVIETGSPVTEVTGLTWLQGKTVSILADGAALPNQVVPDDGADAGKVIIPDGFSPTKVHVGLPYESRAIPMPIPAGFGNKTHIDRLYLVFHDTIGGKYGIYDDLDKTTEDYAVLMAADLDASPDLFSGILEVKYPGSWAPFKSVMVGQGQPLPMELLSIRITFVTGVK